MQILRSRTAERLIRPGQPIFWGHKRVGIGPEMLANGDFSNGATGWTAVGASVSVVGGVARYTAAAIPEGYEQPLTLTTGVRYQVTYTIVSITAGSVAARLMGGVSVNAPSRSTPGTYTEILVAGSNGGAGNTACRIGAQSAGTSCDIDNVSCKRLG